MLPAVCVVWLWRRQSAALAATCVAILAAHLVADTIVNASHHHVQALAVATMEQEGGDGSGGVVYTTAQLRQKHEQLVAHCVDMSCYAVRQPCRVPISCVSYAHDEARGSLPLGDIRRRLGRALCTIAPHRWRRASSSSSASASSVASWPSSPHTPRTSASRSSGSLSTAARPRRRRPRPSPSVWAVF